MLVLFYRARITTVSGQVFDLESPRLKTITSAISNYEDLDISNVVIMKCRKVVADGETC